MATSDVEGKENESPQLTSDTCQDESSPQGSANRVGCHDASGHLESLMTQMWQKQAQEMQQNMEAMCTKYRKQKDGTIMRLEAENDELSKKFGSLEAEKQRLEADMKELRQSLMQSETSITTLTREKQAQTAKIDELSRSVDSLKEEKQGLQDVVCTMKRANCELKAEVDELSKLRKENDSLSKRMAYLAARNDTAMRTLHEKMEQVQTAKEENQAVSEALKEHMKENETLKVTVQEHSASISHLEGERKLLQDQIGELTQKNMEVEEELMQTQQQYEGVARITLDKAKGHDGSAVDCATGDPVQELQAFNEHLTGLTQRIGPLQNSLLKYMKDSQDKDHIIADAQSAEKKNAYLLSRVSPLQELVKDKELKRKEAEENYRMQVDISGTLFNEKSELEKKNAQLSMDLAQANETMLAVASERDKLWSAEERLQYQLQEREKKISELEQVYQAETRALREHNLKLSGSLESTEVGFDRRMKDVAALALTPVNPAGPMEGVGQHTRSNFRPCHKAHDLERAASGDLSMEMEVVAVPPPSDVLEITGDEVLLQQLCYMATGIKQLLVTPDGGTFTLGSGDASLEFPPGAVAKETSVRYAIILHGPFVFPAMHQPGSVVVYINMDEAILMKPAQLFLYHWCSRNEEDDEAMKFVTAPHTLGAGQKCYKFEEQEADFTTHANMGILKIAEPQCLHCVKGKTGKIARYSAITFTRYDPPEDALLFRIQLMCDSREWNESLTRALQNDEWKKTSSGGIVTRFGYASEQKLIAASPPELKGPGWTAKIEGNCKVELNNFLLPKAKSKSEVEEAISSGLSPPCILYKVFYNVPEEQRVKPAELTVTLHGEDDLNLIFSCRIMEEMYISSPAASTILNSSSYSHQRSTAPSLGVARLLSSLQTEIPNTADVIKALNHHLDAKWREFGTHLHVEPAIMDGVSRDRSGVGDCMLQLVEKWVDCENGTGDLPRTWKTVVQAVKDTGKGLLAEQLAEQYGVLLPGQ